MERLKEILDLNKKKVDQHHLKFLIRILKSKNYRKIKKTSVILKKIKNLKHGIELLEICGYKTSIVRGTPYLILETINSDVITQIIEKVQEHIPLCVEEVKVERVRCSCGFWGQTRFNNLCSVCFKEEETTRKQKLRKQLRKILKSILFVARIQTLVRKKKTVIQKNKKRCFMCNRKCGYLGFLCKCNYVFCDLHRLPSSHNCSFDFKQKHQRKLSKENQCVKAKKLEKIV